jgi:hypothetical protein
MSCVCILTPLVIVAWPAFSAAVSAAATSLGYAVAQETASRSGSAESEVRRVELEIPRSEIVTDTMRRDQRLSVCRDGVTMTFSRDARGRASLCVTGAGKSEQELRALGEALAQRVVQEYVYQRILNEIRSRGFVIAEETIGADRCIRLKVRHWEV